MKPKKTILTLIAIAVIILTITLWAWHKDNWWLLLGIPFSLLFFNNKETVGKSLGYVLTFVLGHIIYTLISGNFQFGVWSWFFFLCGLISYIAANAIYGLEQTNWEKEAKLNGDNRTFEEHERDEFLNSPEIKELTDNIVNQYKK